MEKINKDLEGRIFEIGNSLIEGISKKRVSLNDKVFDLCMKDPQTKAHLLRFIDVLPNLKNNKEIISHLEEYLADESLEDNFLTRGAKIAVHVSKISPILPSYMIKLFARKIAKNFIISDETDKILRVIKSQLKQNTGFSLDFLGEKTTSEADAEIYLERYLSILDFFSNEFGINSEDDYRKPLINLSVKLSSLYSKFDPIDSKGARDIVKGRLRQIFRKAKETGAFVNVDAENYAIKELTNEIFKEILSENDLRDYDNAGVVVQAYLKDSEKTLTDFINWSEEKKHPMTIRLVKGAYWDYEVMLALKNNWEIPVFMQKWKTDENYEKLTKILLENNSYAGASIASHNIRSISNALALKEKFGVGSKNFELQILYGMGKEFKKILAQKNIPLRVYIPSGDLISGMGYFVRRLLENSSNESFLRSLNFIGEPRKLLRNPSDFFYERKKEKKVGSEGGFENFAVCNFSKKENRNLMKDSLEKICSEFGNFNYGLKVGKNWICTEESFEVGNPSKKSEIIGKVSMADKNHVDLAIKEAQKALINWRKTPAEERAGYLFNVAEQMRERIYDLSAMIVFEAGKTWKEAHADVAEAIDFLNFYGIEIKKIGAEKQTQKIFGEENTINYFPKGVVGVIAPWNFPLAILAGMTSASLAAGNTVLMKPSEETPIIAGEFMKMFEKAELPDGVLNYIPGTGEVVGRHLVESPKINMIAFTGSRKVGLEINEKISKIHSNQNFIKTSVLEMGGKNGIIIDATADFDEALPEVLHSAFGFQGQKCSACSRLIVLENVYDKFIERLVKSAKSLRVGDARLPGSDLGPIINKESYSRIINYIEKGISHGGNFLLEGKFDNSEGYYIYPTIIEVDRKNVLAKEEVFGPVLSVIKARDFNEAVEILNDTDYALTGGIYTRTPSHIRQFKQEAMVGNRYINRGITGAIVQRQPFGGFKMSGAGSKAGCREYLLEFMYPISNSINTARQGHIPGIENL